MAHTNVWWHRQWVKTIESYLGHAVAIAVGFAMMVLGLGLGVTIILLPVGIVVGLLGVLVFVGGLFGHIGSKADGSEPRKPSASDRHARDLQRASSQGTHLHDVEDHRRDDEHVDR